MEVIELPQTELRETELRQTELRQTRQLQVGDTLVNASGRAYEVTGVARIGRGIRVQYVSDDGRAGRFTAAPEAVSRVRVGSTSRVA
ncbi:hypothetical protein EV187_1423 [Agromyces ramosus]|uniref:DUF1918 domain-containing protein n=1 Tax=Agromyces ramosus TaxID=33879 RepID=A0A4Q7MG50_9MICO|nr:hypothetical protein [Agromyces ramosus]RZS65722.1 hypothetical protein EV187_1423 [Agromyces ramosus]